ncbi:MAG: FecR domain-containing protein [bacterium]
MDLRYKVAFCLSTGLILLLSLQGLIPPTVFSQSEELKKPINSVEITDLQGTVLYSYNADQWLPLDESDSLPEDVYVRTAYSGKLTVRTRNGNKLQLHENSKLHFELLKIQDDLDQLKLDLQSGKLRGVFDNEKTSSRTKIQTTNAALGIRGTDFGLATQPGRTDLSVFEGKVTFTSQATDQSVTVQEGEQSTVLGNNKPSSPVPMESSDAKRYQSEQFKSRPSMKKKRTKRRGSTITTSSGQLKQGGKQSDCAGKKKQLKNSLKSKAGLGQKGQRLRAKIAQAQQKDPMEMLKKYKNGKLSLKEYMEWKRYYELGGGGKAGRSLARGQIHHTNRSKKVTKSPDITCRNVEKISAIKEKGKKVDDICCQWNEIPRVRVTKYRAKVQYYVYKYDFLITHTDLKSLSEWGETKLKMAVDFILGGLDEAGSKAVKMYQKAQEVKGKVKKSLELTKKVKNGKWEQIAKKGKDKIKKHVENRVTKAMEDAGYSKTAKGVEKISQFSKSIQQDLNRLYKGSQLLGKGYEDLKPGKTYQSANFVNAQRVKGKYTSVPYITWEKVKSWVERRPARARSLGVWPCDSTSGSVGRSINLCQKTPVKPGPPPKWLPWGGKGGAGQGVGPQGPKPQHIPNKRITPSGRFFGNLPQFSDECVEKFFNRYINQNCRKYKEKYLDLANGEQRDVIQKLNRLHSMYKSPRQGIKYNKDWSRQKKYNQLQKLKNNPQFRQKWRKKYRRKWQKKLQRLKEIRKKLRELERKAGECFKKALEKAKKACSDFARLPPSEAIEERTVTIVEGSIETQLIDVLSTNGNNPFNPEDPTKGDGNIVGPDRTDSGKPTCSAATSGQYRVVDNHPTGGPGATGEVKFFDPAQITGPGACPDHHLHGTHFGHPDPETVDPSAVCGHGIAELCP